MQIFDTMLRHMPLFTCIVVCHGQVVFIVMNMYCMLAIIVHVCIALYGIPYYRGI